MAIKFTNIRSGEVKVATEEPMIAAYYNSGDSHPNAQGGQDFGWRLAPETVKRMKEVKANPQNMNTIAASFSVLLEDIKDSHILHWISMQDEQAKNQGQLEDETTHARKYEDDLRAIERGESKPKPEPIETTETDTDNATIEEPAENSSDDDTTNEEEKTNAQ